MKLANVILFYCVFNVILVFCVYCVSVYYELALTHVSVTGKPGPGEALNGNSL